jgi:phenylalanyl-tRNA synthetase alpha chain
VSDRLTILENGLLADIASAGDEPAIEAVRVAALGKKGSVSELLKTLGSMSPEERQVNGPRPSTG